MDARCAPSETSAIWTLGRPPANRIASPMGPISVRRPIDAPRQQVFDFLCDLANRPPFTDHFIDQFRLERLESLGVGAAARMRITKRRVWREAVIEEVAPPRWIVASARGGGRGDRSRIPL